jgi:hypothetical protein
VRLVCRHVLGRQTVAGYLNITDVFALHTVLPLKMKSENYSLFSINLYYINLALAKDKIKRAEKMEQKSTSLLMN